MCLDMNHKFLFQKLRELALLASRDISAEDREKYKKAERIDDVLLNYDDIFPLIHRDLEKYYKVMVSHFDRFLIDYLVICLVICFECYIISFIVCFGCLFGLFRLAS